MTSRWSVRRLGEERGIALVEVLLVVVISSAILIPLLAFFSLVFGQRPVIVDTNQRIASTGLLAAYFDRDVAVAGWAAIDPSMVDDETPHTFFDCIGGEGQGTPLLVLVRGGAATLTKIVYTETLDGPVDDEATTASVWRRTCDSGTGANTSAIEIVEGVQPGVEVACPTPPSGSSVPCRQIEMSFTPEVDGPATLLRAVRRVDTATASVLASGNRVPVPKISVLSISDRRDFEVVVSAGESFDPDPEGQIVCYQWVFTRIAAEEAGGGSLDPEYVTIADPAPWTDPQVDPPCPERPGVDDDNPGTPVAGNVVTDQLRIMPTSGTYYAELTVTDDRGASNTTYAPIRIDPLDPVVDLRIRSIPEGPDLAGRTVFEFASSWQDEDEPDITDGTFHPDGEILEFRWTVLQLDDEGAPALVAGFVQQGPDPPGPWYTALPPDMAGPIRVTLSVVDQRGTERSESIEFTLFDPADNPLDVAADLTPDPPLGVDVEVGPLSLIQPPGLDGPGSARVAWSSVPEVDRYVVEYTFVGPGDCQITQLIAVAPSAEPSAPLLPNRCGAAGALGVRVAVDLDGERSEWSDMLTVPGAQLSAFLLPPGVTEVPGGGG